MKDIFSLKYFKLINLGIRRVLISITILTGAIFIIVLAYAEKQNFSFYFRICIATISIYWLLVLLYCWVWNGFLQKDRARDYLLNKLSDQCIDLDRKLNENDEYIAGLTEQVIELQEDISELSGRVTDGFVVINNKLKGLEYLRMK